MSSAASRNKKQTGEVEVHVDTQIVNIPNVGASVLQVCQSVGVRCTATCQILPGTITWQLVFPQNSEEGKQEQSKAEELDEVLAILPVAEFVSMVASQVQQTSGVGNEGQSLTQYIKQLQSLHPGKHVSVVAVGLEKYFSDRKLDAKRKHREEVTGQRAKAGRKGQDRCGIWVTRLQVEEAVVSAQLETGCCCRLLENAQEVAELVKTYTKAIIDKPNKKDRFDSVFSFLEEGGTGVKCDKDGTGLLKVWRLQLQQLHNLGPEMAAAIAAEYPSPLALLQAYQDYPNPEQAWKVTENIVVRRGPGVLETGRRVGPQLSKRIHTLMTSTDPDKLVK